MRRPTAILIALSVALVVTLAGGCGGSGESSSSSGDNQGGGDRQDEERTFATEQEAARDALETFTLLVTKENHKAMGFDSDADVKSASLGEPIQVRMVRLDQLKTFQPGSDPNPLLQETRQVIYPVLIRDETRSSVMLAQSGPGEWRAVSFGNPRLAKQIAETRRRIAAVRQSAQAAPTAQASPTPAQTPPTQSAPPATAPLSTPTPTTPTTTPATTPSPQVVAPDVVVHVAALNLRFIGHLMGGRWMLTPLENAPDYQLEAGRAAPAEEIFASLAANPIVQKYNGLPL